MNSNLKCEVLNEYFNIVSSLLSYESSETICEIERKVLAFLCEIKKCTDMFSECWKMIESAKCLQTCSDVALLDSSDISHDIISYDIKRDALVAAAIKKVKRFNETNFVEEIKSNANIGDINSCKLLAIMNWNGILLTQNPNVAKRIWSFLAMNGDLLSIDMLINSMVSEEEINQQQKWKNIRSILETEYDSFSAIATYSNYPLYSEEDVQTSNLIMFISQRNTKSGAKFIDRPMTQYVLDSTDDYKTKMIKLSADTNFYLVMHVEGKYSNKEYGF